ncbi:MAG: HAMP domain-containing histidine kinase [Planctomycetes bacterium]|nr:HAMP domain-containing histidine kinase [Planctomycetota bacterium]
MALAVLAFVLGCCAGALLARRSGLWRRASRRPPPQEPRQLGRAGTPRANLHLAGFVHELRTPLAAIRAYAELLAGASSDRAFLEEASGILVEEAERLDALIGQHLDRVQRGPVEVVSALPPGAGGRCELGSEARAATELLRPLAASRGLSIELDERTPRVEVRGEGAVVRQILANLLGNAVKHALGGTRIVLRWEAAEDRAWIEVEDDGPGVPADEAEALFEPFARGDRAGEGHGLGLWVARELARACGGELELRSREANERGACFRLRLSSATARLAEATLGGA